MIVYPLGVVIIACVAFGIIAAIATFLFCKREYMSTIRRLILEEKRNHRKWKQKVNAAFQEGLQQGLAKSALDRNQLATENRELRDQIKMEALLDKRLISKGKVINCPLVKKDPA